MMFRPETPAGRLPVSSEFRCFLRHFIQPFHGKVINKQLTVIHLKL